MDMLDFQIACTETNCCPLPRDWPPAEFHFFNTELAHPGCRKDTCKMRKWWSNLEIGGIPDYPGPFLCQTNSGDRQVAGLPAKPGMRDRRMQRLPLLDQKMPCPSRRTWRKWTGRPDMTHVSHRDRVTFHLAAESSQMVLQWLQKMISIRRQFRSGSSRLQPMPVFSSQLQAEAERQRL